MLAISYERDLLQRHDAVVDTVVRDRITESKKAERYRLAWLSAKQGRKSWRGCYENAVTHWLHMNREIKKTVSASYHDQMMTAYRRELAHVEAVLEGRERELADLRLAFSELEGARAQEPPVG